MNIKLSIESIHYLEQLAANKQINDHIELLEYRLKDKGYDADTFNKIQELKELKG